MKLILACLLSFSAFCAEEEGKEGKVFVQSVPPGAAILTRDPHFSGKFIDTGVKTPGLVTLVQGPHRLTLRKEGFADATLSVVVGDAIQKPDPVKLEVPKIEVEVTSTDPGWLIFANGSPLRDKLGKRAVTPCTVLLPLGSFNLGWAKVGFADIVQKVTVDKDTVSLETKAKPRAGNSALLALRAELVAGVYDGVHPEWKARCRVELTAEGGVNARDESKGNPGISGRWIVRGNDLVLQWFKFPAEPLTYDPATGTFADKKGFILTPRK